MKIFKKKKIEDSPKLDTFTVEEIHQDFKSASELMQKEFDLWLKITSNFIEEEKKKDIKLKEKSLNLQKLGFCRTPEVIKLEEEQRKMNKTMEEVREKENVLKLVQHYKMYYPQHKFITNEIVESLCQKYNLWCVPVKSYTGSVPDDCVEEMVNFKVRIEDSIIELRHSFGGDWISYSYADDAPRENVLKNLEVRGIYYEDNKYYRINNTKMICCPKSSVDLESVQSSKYYSPEKGGWFKPEPKDPIVLTPVNGGYLIVSAWGIESQDPEVFNENKN